MQYTIFFNVNSIASDCHFEFDPAWGSDSSLVILDYLRCNIDCTPKQYANRAVWKSLIQSFNSLGIILKFKYYYGESDIPWYIHTNSKKTQDTSILKILSHIIDDYIVFIESKIKHINNKTMSDIKPNAKIIIKQSIEDLNKGDEILCHIEYSDKHKIILKTLSDLFILESDNGPRFYMPLFTEDIKYLNENRDDIVDFTIALSQHSTLKGGLSYFSEIEIGNYKIVKL